MTSGRLIVREERPYNAGTPAEALAGPIVPDGLFYVRSHFDVPALDPAAWRLAVEGAVERPLSLSLAELRELPRRTVAVTLECAGNGREALEPKVPGTPWGFDAVSTARFGGTPLAGVLERAGVRPEAVEIVFEGADAGAVAPGREEAYGRSLPPAEAVRPDVLLAWEMNGQPLPPAHGAPVRLVVPGWYGMASVKWLVRIEAVETPFRGFYQFDRYVFVDDPEEADGTPVARMLPRAAIARPAAGERLAAGPVEIAGTAWSGLGPIERVEVSVDGGAGWEAATLGEPAGPAAAVPWTFAWDAAPGAARLAARATDATGRTQPLEPRWNRWGYANNVVELVPVTVG